MDTLFQISYFYRKFETDNLKNISYLFVSLLFFIGGIFSFFLMFNGKISPSFDLIFYSSCALILGSIFFPFGRGFILINQNCIEYFPRFVFFSVLAPYKKRVEFNKGIRITYVRNNQVLLFKKKKSYFPSVLPLLGLDSNIRKKIITIVKEKDKSLIIDKP